MMTTENNVHEAQWT